MDDGRYYGSKIRMCLKKVDHYEKKTEKETSFRKNTILSVGIIIVLDSMVKNKMITKEEADRIVSEKD